MVDVPLSKASKPPMNEYVPVYDTFKLCSQCGEGWIGPASGGKSSGVHGDRQKGLATLDGGNEVHVIGPIYSKVCGSNIITVPKDADLHLGDYFGRRTMARCEYTERIVPHIPLRVKVSV